MCDVCVQKAWSCSCYVVQPSQPVVGEVFKFSAHSLLNDALYSPCSMLNAWKMCPWKCGGSHAGGGRAGSSGVVQDTKKRTWECCVSGCGLSYTVKKLN